MFRDFHTLFTAYAILIKEEKKELLNGGHFCILYHENVYKVCITFLCKVKEKGYVVLQGMSMVIDDIFVVLIKENWANEVPIDFRKAKRVGNVTNGVSLETLKEKRKVKVYGQDINLGPLGGVVLMKPLVLKVSLGR